jgi:hypothetical protein
MPGVTQRRLRPRAAALLAAGGYVLHQLRYALGYGGHAHEELASQGHAYMTFVAPLLAVAVAALLADLGLRIVAAERPAPAPRLRRLWALATASLLLAYLAQELIEGALAAGHPAGLEALTAGGGWVALPLAAALGLALALLARGAHAALELAAEPAPRVARPRAGALVRGARAPRSLRIRLASGPAAARGPPAAATA